MPPIPKPKHLRQRTNKVAGMATLPSSASSATNEVPLLPERAAGWHPMVLEWWDGVWRSPMASEYLDADMRGGLYLLAELHQKRWESDTTADLVKVAAEIRLQEVRFGLSPIDRRRLQWEVERGEGAVERMSGRAAAKQPKAGKDPRGALKLA